MTIQQNRRRAQASRNLRANRDLLTRSLQGVRLSIEEAIALVIPDLRIEAAQYLGALQMQAGAEPTPETDAQGRSLLVFEIPTGEFTDPDLTEPELDENDDPIEGTGGEPIPGTGTPVTQARKVWVSDGGLFVYAKPEGYGSGPLAGVSVREEYVYPEADSPTVREFVRVLLGFLSYAHYAGEPGATAEGITSVLGMGPVDTTELAPYVDTWR